MMSRWDRVWEWGHRVSSATGIIVLVSTVISGIGTYWAVLRTSSETFTPAVWLTFFFFGIAALSVSFAYAFRVVKQRQPSPQVALGTVSRFSLDGAALKFVEGAQYRAQTVPLDGHHYRKCRFVDVTFQFNGGPFLMEDIEIAPPVSFNSDLVPVKTFVKFVSDVLKPMVGKARKVPDEWFREGIVYAVHRKWLQQSEQALTEKSQKELAGDLFEVVRQHARNGAITVFGKIWENSTWDPIHPDYWANHEVSVIELFRSDNPELSHTSSATPEGRGPIYKSLKINKSEFEALWPASS